jgi:uncharacterized protein YgiM (DUF1202 family)
MKHKVNLVYLLIILGLTLLLTACLTTPLVVEGEMSAPVVTLVTAEPTAELLATPDRTETAELPSSTQPILTPFVPPPPTNTPAPASGPPPTITSPAPTDPHFVTQDVTAVRVGPGLDYELSHFLGPGTTVMLAGRNAEGGWWAIHGPGDGPGPRSWVADTDVTVAGNINNLPVLPAPILPPTPIPSPDVPFIGETGPPPTEHCIVSHPGEGGAINIHLGPGEQFALVARLDKGRWAESIQGQVGWYEIRLGPGEVGWVNGTAVAVNEHC